MTDAGEQIGQNINGKANDELGNSISLSNDGDIIAIGVKLGDGSGNSLNNSGEVLIYKDLSNNWQQLGETIYGEGNYDKFGHSVSLSGNGNILAASATHYDVSGTDNRGIVRIFQYNDLSNNWIQLGNDIIGDVSENYFGSSIIIKDGTHMCGQESYNNDDGIVRVYKFNTTTNSGNKKVQL